MVLNNYRSMANGRLHQQPYTVINQSGQIQSHSYSDGGALRANANIVVGSGNTTPTAEDYTLANELSLTTTAAITSNVVTENNITKTLFTKTYRNDTGNEVTIAEYGLVSTSISTLLTRAVLDSPITLANGESVTITLTLG